MNAPLLEVRDLRRHFAVAGGGVVKAVDGVSFALEEGRTLALVGESGCGKTTTALTIVGLLEPTSGRVLFRGAPVAGLGRAERLAFRRNVQIVFQDPQASLNPRMSVEAALEEPIRVHGLADGGQELRRRVGRLLEMVGLDQTHRERLPRELSGGQRQRVGIARALAVEPEILVLDEPVTALDVSVQAQILGLLGRLQAELGLSYLLVAHDLALVRHVSHRVAVMYLGKLMEVASTREIFARPRHPYTRSLLNATPRLQPGRNDQRSAFVLSGELPSQTDPPEGCPLHPRCPHPLKNGACEGAEPPLEAKGHGHFVACWKEPGEGVERG